MSNKIDSFGTSYSYNKVNEKNPIVFIHGVGLTKEIWEPQINFFKDYNTLTYDLLGHGKTPLKKSKVKIEDFYKQLLKFSSLINLNNCLEKSSILTLDFFKGVFPCPNKSYTRVL